MVNFLILLILHILGDFYFQTSKIAKCKNAKVGSGCRDCVQCKDGSKLNYKYIFIHVMIYNIPFVMLFFMTDWLSTLIIIFILFVSHSVIDVLSCFLNKSTKQTIVFIIDQFLHTGVLFLIYKLFKFYSFFNEYSVVVRIVFMILMLAVPCSIFINKLFEDLYPGTIDAKIFDIGSIIGILERFLVVIFSYFEDFAAIAIIITVKTWARSNDLKEPDFRNKYLLGTLASLVLALVIFILVKNIPLSE